MFEETDTIPEALVEPSSFRSGEQPVGTEQPMKPLTRRQVLRAAAISGVALAGGSILAACGSGSQGPTTVTVTFTTNGYPGDSLPTTTQQKSDISLKAYADALSTC